VRFRVWRTHNERFAPWATKGTIKHDKKIMVWGCFSAHAVGIMDAVMFNRILQNVVKPSFEELYPDDDYMFQQDNDPKHTAIINRNYMASNINCLDWWPAQSPEITRASPTNKLGGQYAS
jgi:hypothetical protein